MKAALMEYGGYIGYTAKMLDVCPDTIRNYIRRYPDLKKVIKKARKNNLDLAQGYLMELIAARDFPAIKYFLSCKGKHLGYGVHKEVSVNAKVPGPVINIVVPAGVSQGKMKELLNKARANAGLDPMPSGMSLQVGLKELPDNKGVVIENGESNDVLHGE
jgi:hypothetical protein